MFLSWGDTNKCWYTLGFCTKESNQFCFSVKNQVAGRVDVVEDGGAEVERRREGEEGLEGPEPLHEVAGSDGANYGRHRPDAVREPCSRGRRSCQSDTEPEECSDGYRKLISCLLDLELRTYRARIQRIWEQCPAREIKENTFRQIDVQDWWK